VLYLPHPVLLWSRVAVPLPRLFAAMHFPACQYLLGVLETVCRRFHGQVWGSMRLDAIYWSFTVF
jgi:hypothetical protein